MAANIGDQVDDGDGADIHEALHAGHRGGENRHQDERKRGDGQRLSRNETLPAGYHGRGILRDLGAKGGASMPRP